ncbi:4'-phosphopantetheinyl transferase family protein [Paenibacillus caseinilyticus]|uniref:4'-phosphopantetheinyl transferase family protein n=1 Tax=Paenibacillus caseinilyticus TaxID=3098138 RepID=UPI0022B8C2B7|nr:4'-phosphopantetheinyl transferase superfamily protein [Paenibacillus caseinilyticus]MCZ8521627.1 4'-phosphopantetheinyl transferase superfamily protein [Paenibacillus caseinilyticus]
MQSENGTLGSEFLSETEQAQFHKLRYERRRLSFLLGRYAAKLAVSAWTGAADLRQTEIESGIFGQPVVRCGSSLAAVSISHSQELGAAAAYPDLCPLGIDIEKREPRNQAALERQLTEGEKALARQLPGIMAMDLFGLVLWTIKESLSKALKTGFTVPMELFEVKKVAEENGCWHSTFVHFPLYQALSVPMGDYILSVAYPASADIGIDMEGLKTNFTRILPPGLIQPRKEG